MAIFSLSHSFIGRSTHAAGSASLFARYITRPEACTELVGERMPGYRRGLMGWLDQQEQDDRKNARVIDKVIVALPNELSHEQNVELVRAFGERMTEGRASWVAAIHDGPKDAGNPHAHFIFRDRDVDTGKRVMLTTERGSTQRFRDGWEQEANIALERAGFDARIDKRSLFDQGIDREPQLHVGAGAEKLAEKLHEFRSDQREVSRIINGERTVVTVNYPEIDQGRTRFEENEERKQRNLERESGAMELADGKPDRLTAMESLQQAEVRLTVLYQLIAQTGEDGALSGDQDALAYMAAEHFSERHEEGLFAREPASEVGSGHATERAPRKDGFDLVGGAGLALMGKLSEMVESLMDGPVSPRTEKEQQMADERKTERVVEQQQRQAEAETAAWRKAELEAYLQRRDRERHHDRGR
jgi:hypothetical protein